MNTYLSDAEKIKEYVVGLRRYFHANPELSLKEFLTSEKIEKELDELGIEHKRAAETGVIGILRGKEASGRVTALRADIDALPIYEKNDVPYRSQNDGVMHACGHDAHTAMLLGAAKLLAAKRDELKGEVRFLFQPAEEIGKGGKLYTEQRSETLGDAARVFGIHCAPDLGTGIVGVKKGINNASVDHFTINIEGKSAHVCNPSKGVDALYIASQIVVALQGIVSRMTSPLEPVVIGVGKLEAGTGYNIIAGNAQLEGTTRNISEENRKKVNGLVEETANSIARLYGGKAEVVWEDFASVLINPADICDEAVEVIDDVLGKGHVKTDREIYLSGDDFCEYQKECQGVYVYLGTGNADKENTRNPYHTDNFDIDEDALTIGAALYAAYAEKYINS